MLFFTFISNKLNALYVETCTSQCRPDAEIAADLQAVATQSVVCRCPASLRAVDLYGSLIAIRRPGLATLVVVTDDDRAEVGRGYDNAQSFDELLTMMRMNLGEPPARQAAYTALVAETVTITGEAAIAARHGLFAVEELEARLSKDPSRSDLWIEAAMAHRRAGSRVRARQLLRRARASAFPERDKSHVVLIEWINSEWRAGIAPYQAELAANHA